MVMRKDLLIVQSVHITINIDAAMEQEGLQSAAMMVKTTCLNCIYFNHSEY